MDKIFMRPGYWPLLLAWLLSGCTSFSLSGSAAANNSSAVGQIERHSGSILLTPVPLYGLSGLSLGARWHEGESLLLELCDSRNRNLQLQKPLVIYLDGERAYLEWSGKGVGGCHEFVVTKRELADMGAGERVILRVFFESGVVEQRVSGTTSDYFARPKYYGPQSRIKQFVEALPESLAKNQWADG